MSLFSGTIYSLENELVLPIKIWQAYTMSKLPPIYDILKKGEEHLANPEVVEANKKAVEELKKKNAMPPSNQSSKGGRKTKISTKFNRCVKSVKKTVRARKGSNKESAAIAICTTSVLHKRGRTIKRYSRKRLVTQKKFRGGATPAPVPRTPTAWESLATEIDDTLQAIGNNANAHATLEQTVIEKIRTAPHITEQDMDSVLSIFSFAIEAKSKKIMEELYQRGMKKETMSMILEHLLERPEQTAEFREELEALQPFVANLT